LKVLLLTHPEFDYGAASMFPGLCSVFDVVDFPRKYSYYGEDDRLQHPTVQRFCRERSDHYLARGGVTGPAKWTVPQLNRKDYTEDEVTSMYQGHEFDVIFFGPRDVSTWFLRQLREIHIDTPCVLFDYEDYWEIREDLVREFDVNLYFKTGLIRELSPQPYVFGIFYASPIIGSPFEGIDDLVKVADVQVRLGLTDQVRRIVVENLLRLHEVNFRMALFKDMTRTNAVQGFTGLLSYPEYATEIAQCKISVSVGGHSRGRHPLRHFEIPAYRTLMLCERPLVEYPYPLEDRVHCVFFNPEDRYDLLEKISYYLRQNEEREEIALQGKEHVHKYHSSVARAQYVSELVRSRFMGDTIESVIS